ncbi:F-box associated domain, type 1 [Artemisia annua]|uniref:F-box associated domain, type 1 n=1 Tax=Artemisia annua TaxID=35608 RepID=A0A2U1LWK5_ARTAN|nr:F-box associated domain, type 1 [Artemisia annua]
MNLEEGTMRGIEDLEENLMLDIFSRLNVRTILCCKCVCKKWHDIVLDPYFVNNMWPKNPNNLGLMIHHVTITGRGGLHWIEIEEEEEDFDVARILTVDLSTPRELKRFDRYPGFCFQKMVVGGSVEGLICVWSIFHTTWIINPVTKEYMNLPDAPSSLSLSNTRPDIISYGFGASVGAKAYKVIRIYKTSTIEIEVFTLGTDQWRTLERQDHYNELVCNYMKAGLFFNGHVHWIDSFGRGKLFVFELDNETFNSFPSPPPVYDEKQEKISFGCLGVLKGCLSQCCWYSSRKSSVWVMKEHGVKDSWYKAFTINETKIASYPLCVIDSLRGAILIVRDEKTFAAYCLQTSTLKRVSLACIDTYIRIDTAITYRPTLLKLQNFASLNTVVQAF